MRFEIRIHPVERETFLDEEFTVGVFVEDDFGQQAVDFHDRNLAADLKLAIRADGNVFTLFELMLLNALLGVFHIVLEAFFRIFIRWRVNLRAIHAVEIFQIGAVGQRILREREKWIAVHMRFLHRRDQEPSWIRAAKINAARRNGINDVVAVSGGIFFIALAESIQRAPGLQHRLPRRATQTLIWFVAAFACASFSATNDFNWAATFGFSSD